MDQTPISFKHSSSDLISEEAKPQGFALLFPNGLRAHFGSGCEKILIELLNQSLRGGHV